MSSLADYNNNPGNLKPPKGVTYDGQIGVDENGFAVFENKKYGRAALLNDIEHKVQTHKINNAEDFIDRYSPAGTENSEDSRDNYKLSLINALGLSSTRDPFPKDSHERIADVISQFESGEKPSSTQENASTAEGNIPPSIVPKAVPVQRSERKEGKDLYPYGYLGAAAGTTIAGGLEAGKQIWPLLENLKNAGAQREINPNAPSTRSGLTKYMRSQLHDPLKGMTLKQMEEATQQATGRPKIRMMKEVQDALKEVYGTPETTVEKPKVKLIRPDVFEKTNEFRVSQTPAKPPLDLTKYETKEGIRAALLRQGAKAAEGATRYLPSIARVGLGGAGAAGAAMSGYNAIEDYKEDKGFSPRVVMGGMNALGGGLMSFPFPVTQAAGALLMAPQTTADLAGYAAKKMEEGGLEYRPDLSNY